MGTFIINSDHKFKRKPAATKYLSVQSNLTCQRQRHNFALNGAAMFQNVAKRTASDKLESGQPGSEPSPVTSLSHRNAQ